MSLSIGLGTDPDGASIGDSRGMQFTTFERPEDFRRWLERHHSSERELWVGYFKKSSGRPSMTWRESGSRAGL